MSSSISVLDGRYAVPQARLMDSCATVVVLERESSLPTTLRVTLMPLSQALPTVQLQRRGDSGMDTSRFDWANFASSPHHHMVRLVRMGDWRLASPRNMHIGDTGRCRRAQPLLWAAINESHVAADGAGRPISPIERQADGQVPT